MSKDQCSLPVALFAIALATLCHSVEAQDLSAYLPAKAAAKASRLLAAVDKSGASLAASRASTRAAQLKAEAEACEAYSLAAAARAGSDAWASPDGSRKEGDALAALAAARSKAKAAAAALAAGEGGGDDSATALAKLLLESGIAAKQALGLEKALRAGTKDLDSMFPELLEIEELLKKTGAPGAREAAVSMLRRCGAGIAASMLDSRQRILAIAPGADGALIRLDGAYGAYRLWIAASAIAAYPGELRSIGEAERSALAGGLRALAGLRPSRAASLLSAMAAGDGREQAAAGAARRLALAWDRSPESRRHEMAELCGVPESVAASFASVLAEASARNPAMRRDGTRILPSSAPSSSPRLDPLSSAYALSALNAALAEVEASAVPLGTEPSLILLERPELARVARSEKRYASLYAETTRRLDAIYAQAEESASARLEASAALAKAASRALGKAPASLVVRALSLDPGSGSRLIAFIASASDASGSSVSMPIGSGLAAGEYAVAFAKAAGITDAKTEKAALLAKYGQRIVCAYDPESSGESLAIDYFPGPGSARPYPDELEYLLLEGGRW
jgi:hypothetical protein